MIGHTPYRRTTPSRPLRSRLPLFWFLVLGLVGFYPASPTEAYTSDWQEFWQARSVKQASKQAQRLTKTSVAIEEAVSRLKEGRPYSSEVKTGLIRKSQVVSKGQTHQYAIVVPKTYDPRTAHQVIVHLHGGVGRPAPERGEKWWSTSFESADDGEIVVLPAGWDESSWWDRSQVKSLNRILDELKRSYNIDENRVALMGVSDGGTGAYFQAFRNTTPWASFLPLIGHSRVLGNPQMGADGDMFPVNLSNKPLFVVNGAHDRLYPSWSVAPYLDLFASAGAKIEFRHQPDSGHDLKWWPKEAEALNRFIAENPRDPLPERLAWETETTDRYNRNHWLLITELGGVAGEPDLPSFDTVLQPGTEDETVAAFHHSKPSGRVEVIRRGNTIASRTEGVVEFHLLLSPDEIDFSAPLVVRINGQEVFSGDIPQSLDTLMHWAALDNDRTMLFTAEVKLDVADGSLSVVAH